MLKDWKAAQKDAYRCYVIKPQLEEKLLLVDKTAQLAFSPAQEKFVFSTDNAGSINACLKQAELKKAESQINLTILNWLKSLSQDDLVQVANT